MFHPTVAVSQRHRRMAEVGIAHDEIGSLGLEHAVERVGNSFSFSEPTRVVVCHYTIFDVDDAQVWVRAVFLALPARLLTTAQAHVDEQMLHKRLADPRVGELAVAELHFMFVDTPNEDYVEVHLFHAPVAHHDDGTTHGCVTYCLSKVV